MNLAQITVASSRAGRSERPLKFDVFVQKNKLNRDNAIELMRLIERRCYWVQFAAKFKADVTKNLRVTDDCIRAVAHSLGMQISHIDERIVFNFHQSKIWFITALAQAA